MSRCAMASQPWGVLQDPAGNAMAASASIKNRDGSPATHYSALTGGTSSTSSVTFNANGTLTRFIDGGEYLISVPSIGVVDQPIDAVSGSVESKVGGLDVSATVEGVLPGLGSQKAAIEAAAIKAVAEGKPLRFQAATTPYNTAGLSLDPAVKILLDPGACIARNSGATGTLITTSSPATGLTIIGGQIDNGSSTDKVISLAAGPEDVTIKGVDFTSMGSAGEAFLVTESSTSRPVNITIEDNSFTGPGVNNSSCIFCANADGMRVKNNRFIGVGAVGMTGTGVGENIYLGGNYFENVNATNMQIRNQGSGQLRNIIVEGNISNMAGVPLGKGLCTVGEQVLGTTGSSLTKGVVVANNRVKYFNGVAISIGGGVSVGVIENVAVTGNIIDASNLSDVYDVASSGISAVSTTNLTITGNHVRNCGRSGIRLYTCNAFSVTGNVIDSCVQGVGLTSPTADDEHGICLIASCTNGAITGNVSKNNGTVLNATNGTAGIGTTAHNHANIVITGNRCYDDRGGSAAQAFGLKIGATDIDANQPTFFTVTANDFTGNATQAIKTFNTTPKGHQITTSAATSTAEAKRAAMLPSGALDSTLDRGRSTSNGIGLAVSGKLTLVGVVMLRAGQPYSSITVHSGSTAMVTPANQWFTLIDVAAGNAILAKTVDNTTTAWGTVTARNLAITGAPYTPTVDTLAYIGVLIVAATMPSLMGFAGLVNDTGLAPIIAGQAVAGLTTPASFTAVGAITASAGIGMAWVS